MLIFNKIKLQIKIMLLIIFKILDKFNHYLFI